MKGIHEIVAAFAGDGFRLSDEEATELAERWVDVEDAFDIVFLDKWVVLAAFLGTVASIEIPRVKDAVMPKVMRPRKDRPQEATSSVTDRPRLRIP